MSYTNTSAVKGASSTVNLRSHIDQKPVLGTFQVIPSEAVTDLLAWAGADFVIVDGEHSTFTVETLEKITRAGEAAGVAVLYRVASSLDDLSKALDTGIAGIVVPRVEQVQEVEAIVRSVRFPPLGARGLGPGRASKYGLQLNSLRHEANAQVMLVVMIETRQGLENIHDLVAQQGVDVIMVGPADLASSLQTETGSQAHLEAIQTILKAALTQDKKVGIHCADLSDAQRRIQEGFSFLPIGLDTSFLYASALTAFDLP